MDSLLNDKKAIEEILQQAPPEVDYATAKLAYHKAKRNISQALADLWNLPPPPKKKEPTGENAKKWEEVRHMCDEFDAAATEAMKDIMKRQNNSGASVETTSIVSPIIRTCENE